MKTFYTIVAVLVLFLAAKLAYTGIFGTDEIEYRGEKVRLSRKYTDYDVYKNDPDNIATSELPRVERLMREAKIGPVFKDWGEFVDAAFELKFPGYGMGGGPRVVATDRDFLVDSIEIPTRGTTEKFRYFVLEKRPDGSLLLVDDFIDAGRLHLHEVRLVYGQLVYFDQGKTVVRATKL